MLLTMLAPPLRKISDTIVDFGEPLLGQLDASQQEEVVRATFDLVILIWNAHVMALPRWGQPKFLADLHERLRGTDTPNEMIDAVRTLSQRRLERFATDARAVGEWRVAVQQGQWQLRCDARVPNA